MVTTYITLPQLMRGSPLVSPHFGQPEFDSAILDLHFHTYMGLHPPDLPLLPEPPMFIATLSRVTCDSRERMEWRGGDGDGGGRKAALRSSLGLCRGMEWISFSAAWWRRLAVQASCCCSTATTPPPPPPRRLCLESRPPKDQRGESL